jgi:hypothetical protein
MIAVAIAYRRDIPGKVYIRKSDYLLSVLSDADLPFSEGVSPAKSL